jgi:hypothetical protein
MMMTEFEDATHAPRLSIGERIFLWFLVAGNAIGLLAAGALLLNAAWKHLPLH